MAYQQRNPLSERSYEVGRHEPSVSYEPARFYFRSEAEQFADLLYRRTGIDYSSDWESVRAGLTGEFSFSYVSALSLIDFGAASAQDILIELDESEVQREKAAQEIVFEIRRIQDVSPESRGEGHDDQ